jgi:hypothetical protein
MGCWLPARRSHFLSGDWSKLSKEEGEQQLPLFQEVLR